LERPGRRHLDFLSLVGSMVWRWKGEGGRSYGDGLHELEEKRVGWFVKVAVRYFWDVAKLGKGGLVMRCGGWVLE